jgi:hypothetical protein
VVAADDLEGHQTRHSRDTRRRESVGSSEKRQEAKLQVEGDFVALLQVAKVKFVVHLQQRGRHVTWQQKMRAKLG